MNDEDLKEMLREWRAPEVPQQLEGKILARRDERRGLNWLLTGTIRVPVPALIVALIIVAVLFLSLRRPAPQVATQTGLAGFQPVQQLNPRVVGRNYEVQ